MRKNKFHRRHSHHLFAKLLLLVLCGGALFWGVENKPFGRMNTKKIVEETVLKEKTFETMPQEVKAEGLTAWLLEDHTVPLISVKFMFQNAGWAYDPAGQEGRARLSAQILTLGAGKHNRFEFQELLELNGINLSFSLDRDDFFGTLLTPSEHKETAFALLKDALTTPSLSASDIKLNQTQLLIALKTEKEDPEDELALEFAKVLYKNHPYGRDPLGKAEDIKRLDARKLRNFLKDNLAQDNLLIGVAGDISAEETKLLLQEVFKALPEVSKSKPLKAPQTDFNAQPTHIKRETAQTVVRLAAPGVTRTDPDFYPLYIANEIFGGAGLNSRLSLKARENEGLTYGIGTYLSTTENTPLVIGYFSATPENAAKALEIFKAEWQNFAQKGASKAEFEAARNYLLASYNLRFSSTESMADMLLGMQKYNLGLDFLQKRNTYVKNVRLPDVNKAAQKYFQALPLEVSIGTKE